MYAPGEESVVSCLKGVPEKRPAGRERSLRSRGAQEVGHSRHRVYLPSKFSGDERKRGIEHQWVQHFRDPSCDPDSTAETESSRVEQSGAERVLLMKCYH